MKAFLMCAGLGIRLLPITKILPKPMIKINNSPILLNTVNLLKHYNISDITINLHHMPLIIKNFFKDGKDFGVKINYSFEENLLGTAGGLAKVKKFFSDESFLVISGDILFDINLLDAIDFHKNHNSIATIILKDYDFSLKYGAVSYDKNNKILDFIEKPYLKDLYPTKINTGIYIFNPEIFDFIEENSFQDFANLVFPKILKKGINMYAYETKNYWNDIGDINAYISAQKDVLSGKLKTFLPDTSIKNNILIGKNCNISEKTIFDGFNTLGNNVIVDDDVYLKNTIIHDNVIIKKHSSLNGTIVCDNTVIQNNTEVHYGILL